jgi:hypothetical protein
VILAPLFAAVGGLLALAGAAKVRAQAHGAAPYPAPGSALGIPGTRVVAALEFALGAAAIAVPGRLVATVVAVAFAAFAAYTVRLIVAAEAQADCGCFGQAGIGHATLDLGCAAIAIAAVFDPPRALSSLVREAPLTGGVLVAGVVAAVYGIYLAYTALPSAWRAFEGTRQP